MDPSFLCLGDQTLSAPALTNSQTWDLQSLCPPQSPIDNRLAEAESVSEPADISAEMNPSKSNSQVRHTDSDGLKPFPSSCNLSEGPETVSKEAECSISSYSAVSEPVSLPLSHLSPDHISPIFESKTKEQVLSFSFTQENNTPQPYRDISSTSEGLMEPSISKPPASSDHSQATFQLMSSSYQPDSLEGDTATGLESDLYIFESETLEFILSPHVNPKETCPEYQPFSQSRGEKADPDCDPHTVMCDSENAVTQCHLGWSHEQAMPGCDSDMSQHKKLSPSSVKSCAAAMMLVNDGRRGTAEVTVSSPKLPRSDSPVELWLDACQYLAGEDVEDRDVLDNNGLSVTQVPLTVTSDLAFPARDTQVSGYNRNGCEGIGWSDDDTLGWGPPVERWSSVDSWASALSDWSGIFTALPENLTAAFTEIGAEIDALRQALAEVNTHIGTDASQDPEVPAQTQQSMGVQDQPLKTQNLPESSILSGQSCLPSCLVSSGQELQDRDNSPRINSLCGIRPTTPQDIKSSKGCPTHLCASVVSSRARVASLDDVIPESTYSADVDLSHFGGNVESNDVDDFINNDEDPIILNIVEDTDLEGPPELLRHKPLADGLREVTDENRRPVSQLGSAAEQEAQRNFVGTDHKRPDLHFHTTQTRTISPVQDVDTQPVPQINVHTHVSSGTSPDVDRACQLESQWECPKFITPVAPLGIRSSLVCQKLSGASRDHICAKRSPNETRDLECDHLQPCILNPISDGITSKTLVHKKENSIDIAEISSSERHQELDTAESFFTVRTITEDINELSKELSNLAFVPADHFIISEEKHIAVFTLDLNDPFIPRTAKPVPKAVKSKNTALSQEGAEKMPHKTHKTTLENNLRPKKDKCGGHHCAVQASKKQDTLSNGVLGQHVCKQQDTHPITALNHTSENTLARFEDKEVKLTETTVVTEKASSKPHGKKKKKHPQDAKGVQSVAEPLAEVENGAKPKTTKGRVDMFEAKLGAKAGKAHKDDSQHPQPKVPKGEQAHKDQKPKHFTRPLNDDIKRRRLSEDKFGKIVGVLESKLPKPDVSLQAKGEASKVDGARPKKAYSEVVKQKIPPKEEPKVMESIQAQAVSGDPQSLCLWCQFTNVLSQYTVTWSRDGTVLSEIKRSAGDESRVSLTISNASHKDLGKYQCRLTSSNGTVMLDYLLTYEVLSEIVIPPSSNNITSAPVEVETQEENAQCSRLMFKEDFLSEQYFGENQPVSIVTEKVHFGEGMHRRAFRTRLHAGQTPRILAGESCVLKVHNCISYGTKTNEELVQKNFNLAVEECQVQNTAREYIKAYSTAAQSAEAFGEIPEIIPIYLVHRPSNDIPYATLEEELIGDFVKYSVKDGKEINLMRRDSEAGQKCCAFQHWVYHKTEGNLLVTDMQGVGMKLTDVGIATSKKGYKGFKGNCATSFIDQFKALHQCNKYCEILGLKSLQPKAKKPASTLKPKPQHSAAPKKKTFGPTVKGKS